MRRYDLFGCRNLRPVGGFPLPGGGQAAETGFYRADLPLCMGARETVFLKGRDICTVIDLRDRAEVGAKPDALRDCPLVRWYNIPLGGIVPLEENGIAESYVAFLHNKPAMVEIMTLLGGGGATLFHCAAGKDRTGVVAALLMWVAGAAYEDIAADYVVSETLIRPILEELRRARPDLPAFAGRSRGEYMAHFFRALTGEFPGPEDYFTWLGLGEEVLAALRRKLKGG